MILSRISDISSAKVLVLVLTAASIVVSLLIPKLLIAVRLWNIPVAGKDLGGSEKRRQAYLKSARQLYTEGYQKFKNGVFQITTSRKSPVVVVSPNFLPFLKKVGDDILSMSAAVDETMEVKYTKIQTCVPIIPHTIKGDLTPSLVRLNPTIDEEVREALALEMPSSSDWVELDIHKALVRVVAMASGRVFIGPELCRNEQYLDSAINYTIEVMTAQKVVQYLRPWMRPFVASRLPYIKKLDQRIKEVEDFMKPVLEKRQKDSLDPAQNLAKVQLGLGFAAIHTATLTATNAFFDLVALPDFARELRDEAQQALNDNNGVFTSAALQSMKKMDSFLKETLRLYPATMASFQRKVMKPFTLPNGQLIPAGVTIEVPAVGVNADSEVFANADKFDPLRFYHLREQAKEKGSVEGAATNQFVSVSQNSLTFGYGRHACPGRFFAANEIKMILANAIMSWEFKMVGDSKERYPNTEFAHMSIPDFSKKLMCRKILLHVKASETSPASRDTSPQVARASRVGRPLEISRVDMSVNTGNATQASDQSQRDTFSYFNRLIATGPSPHQITEWMSDLELMHHYTAVTCETLPRGPGREGLWKETLPRFALGYEYLMHQVLAFTSLHMACLAPDGAQKFIILASQHQTQAIQGLRATMSDINSVTCHAIFATASLLSLSAFAMSAEQLSSDHHSPSLNNLLEAFSLIRGMHRILKDWEDIISQGPLHKLLLLTSEHTESRLLDAAVQGLNELAIPNHLDPQVQNMYQDEIGKFAECVRLAQYCSATPELRVVTSWPTFFSEELFSLFHKRNITAMVILKHYCYILRSLGAGNWFFKGWGTHVLKDIE
ncbi:Cytochrome P450 monooxygenase ATR2 [Paramyrothecium foliicola]|nr:Cytochrome P450 monooxygenase ATR2 [Paramyrothecium foliicola]